MANIEQKFREACKESGLASMLNQLNNAALNGLVASTLNILKQRAGTNTITGVIKTVGQKMNVSKTGNAFYKRELVLDISRFDPQTGEKYANFVCLNFTQKHCDDLDGFKPGDRVEVKFSVGGREWQGKIINDIVGFGVERIGGAQGDAQAPAAAPQAPQAPSAAVAPQSQQQDSAPQGNPDLPF